MCQGVIYRVIILYDNLLLHSVRTQALMKPEGADALPAFGTRGTSPLSSSHEWPSLKNRTTILSHQRWLCKVTAKMNATRLSKEERRVAWKK